jgi:short subunit dehydrogenase-like uncharacterized protein
MTYDFVLFGATGFTGGLTADYLAEHAPATARWAIVGRSAPKLAAVHQRLLQINPKSKVEVIEADAHQPASLVQVAQATRVVITTVGPYILHGEALVQACAENGTHYCDLTGEPEFVDAMWLKYHAVAQKTGAKLVHCCGFDSIPHDLGAYFTVQQLPEGVPLKVEGFVRASGMFSGGTFHSAMNAFARLREYGKVRSARQRLENTGARKTRLLPPLLKYQRRLKVWAVPFPSIDPQMVQRSAQVLDRYGPDFAYGHYIQVKSLPTAAALMGGVGALLAAAQLKISREWLLTKKPAGEGPSTEKRAKSWFKVKFIGEGGGKTVLTEVSGGDPGYGETAKMLAESGMALAFDTLPAGGGQLSPVAAMGDALLLRLQNQGIRFKVLS